MGKIYQSDPIHFRFEIKDNDPVKHMCPNCGDVELPPSGDPKLKGCLECPRCGFVQGFGTIAVGPEGLVC